MGKRDHYTAEQRARERGLNRARMARAREAMTPAERSAEARRRKDRERRKADRDASWAELRMARRSRTIRRYYESRRDDPDFWAKRKIYLERWLKERREAEEFEAYVARMEQGEADA